MRRPGPLVGIGCRVTAVLMARRLRCSGSSVGCRVGRRTRSLCRRTTRVGRVLTSTISASTAACPPPPPVAVPGSVPNVRVSAATGSSVTVAWDAASRTVGGYRLSRGGSLDGTTSALQWQFSGLSCGTSYSFAVQAYNAGDGRVLTSTISAASAPCASGSPTNTALPTVRGQDAVWNQAPQLRGTWSGHPLVSLSVAADATPLGANCAAIAGQTADSVQRSVDQGLTVRLQVTATNGGGSAKARLARDECHRVETVPVIRRRIEGV